MRAIVTSNDGLVMSPDSMRDARAGSIAPGLKFLKSEKASLVSMPQAAASRFTSPSTPMMPISVRLPKSLKAAARSGASPM